jgi:hypothetical protein
MISMKNALLIFVILFVWGFVSKAVQADPSQESIRTAMDAVETHIEKQKAKHEIRSTHSLSHEASRLGLAVPPAVSTYAAGDQWNIVGFQELPLNSPGATSPAGRSAAFHFEVTSVDAQNIRIRVTPIEAYGLKNIDPRVQYADFTYSKDLKLTSKVYKLHGYADPIPVSPDNFKVGVSVMEGFPLELPPITDAEKDDAFQAPQFSQTFQTAATQAGYTSVSVMEPCWTTWDFFGRGIQSIWPNGQPFPSLMKTTQGYAVLARQEVRQ